MGFFILNGRLPKIMIQLNKIKIYTRIYLSKSDQRNDQKMEAKKGKGVEKKC